MSENDFDAYETAVIRKLNGYPFKTPRGEFAFVLTKYGLKITVTKVRLGEYFCDIENPDIKIKVMANGSDILYAILEALSDIQKAMRPYIMTDAGAKFLADDIRKEFHLED